MASENDRIPPELLDAAVELMGSAGRRGCIPVVGESMVPLLEAGQLLAVDFAPVELSFGDVAVFRNRTGPAAGPPLVVHRYLGRTRFDDGAPALRFRGDGVPWLDPKVSPADVLGRVVGFGCEGGPWWELKGRRAAVWGRAVAAHDLFWSVGAGLARRLERATGRGGGARWLVGPVTALDRGLLRAAHRALFRLFHRRGTPPASPGETR